MNKALTIEFCFLDFQNCSLWEDEKSQEIPLKSFFLSVAGLLFSLLFSDSMTYHFHWAFLRMCLPFCSHEAPRAYTAAQPTIEEQNEQNESGSEAPTNDELERTGPHFP